MHVQQQIIYDTILALDTLIEDVRLDGTIIQGSSRAGIIELAIELRDQLQKLDSLPADDPQRESPSPK